MTISLYYNRVDHGGRYVLYCERRDWPKGRYWKVWDREHGTYIRNSGESYPKHHTRAEARALLDVPLSPKALAWMARAKELWDSMSPDQALALYWLKQG